MKRIKCLNTYQKVLLLLMALMLLVFAALYFRTISRVGFAYQGTILVPSQENGSTVYSGRLRGKSAQFRVSADKTVLFQYGDESYGPYTAREDASAIPEREQQAARMTGVELCQGETVLFRGGVLVIDEETWLIYSEDGTWNNGLSISAVTQDGTTLDENGNVIDPVQPSVQTLLQLMKGPTLTHQGTWLAWLGAAFLCLLNALSMLFADELFRFDMIFQVRDPDRAEPSAWQIAGRYISWTLVTVFSLVIFIAGLQ